MPTGAAALRMAKKRASPDRPARASKASSTAVAGTQCHRSDVTLNKVPNSSLGVARPNAIQVITSHADMIDLRGDFS